jgi:hypothetical protein
VSISAIDETGTSFTGKSAESSTSRWTSQASNAEPWGLKKYCLRTVSSIAYRAFAYEPSTVRGEVETSIKCA